MITFLQALPVGNAVSCLLAHPAGAETTRVLRKVTDDIASESDAAAAVVYEGLETSFVDVSALVNGTPYYYRAFHFDGSVWTATASLSATPAATANLLGPDVREVVRSRLEAGLKAEIAAGRLRARNAYVPCLTAPPAYDGTPWPVVSVHLDLDAAADRGVGELLTPDLFDVSDGEWLISEGWLSRWRLKIIGWDVNADMRHQLSLAIKKILMGNLPVFESLGMSLVEFSFVDVDDMESYAAPVHSTVCDFTCLAPSAVDATAVPIAEVDVDAAFAE